MKKSIKIPNKMGRKEKDFSAKSTKVYLYLPNSVLANWNAARIKQTILDVESGAASLIYAPKDQEVVEQVIEPIEEPKAIESAKPVKAINPIVAQLAASIKGVGTADKPIDKDADRQPGETFQAFAARVFEVEPKPTRYTDSDQKIIDLVLRAYRHKAVNNEGRKSIEAYLNKVINDASDIFVE